MSKSRFSNLLNTFKSHRLPVGFASAASAYGLYQISKRRFDTIEHKDAYSAHTNHQQRKHWFSGMHEALFPTQEQIETLEKHFPQYKSADFVPANPQRFSDRKGLHAPVKILPLKDAPVTLDLTDAKPFVVGGAPALMSAAAYAMNGVPVNYLHDPEGWAISHGAANHLEYDADAEAKTTNRPSTFMKNQFKRALFQHVSLRETQQTGFCPWATIDWAGWMRHADHWPMGIRLALAFQLSVSQQTAAERKAELSEVAANCRLNEAFYEKLNNAVDGKLLFSGKGTYHFARDEAEIIGLKNLQKSLASENREFKLLTEAEMKQQIGFMPNVKLVGFKTHDRFLSPNFSETIRDFIIEKRSNILLGRLTTIYTDKDNGGGIAEYKSSEGKISHVPFSNLKMSLGAQPVLDENNQPLFPAVCARGVTMNAFVTAPMTYNMPAGIVAGGTNHVVRFTDEPAIIRDKQTGELRKLYFYRMTAGATITPVKGESYDSSFALGLVTALQKTLGPECRVEPISAYGCDRQFWTGMSKWISPYKNIDIQCGAGGGGLTQGPLDAISMTDLQSNNVTPRPGS